METVNAISIPFYKFKSPEGLNDIILSELENLNFTPETRPEYGYIYRDYYNEELFDFFDESVRKVAEIYYKPRLSFPIVDCWVNRYKKLNLLRHHKHPNAIISGVYYVTTHQKDGYTRYKMENPWTMDCNIDDKLHIANDNDNALSGHIVAESGTLLLFPPNIIHYMDTMKISNDTRYTIAFNAYASGIISDHDTSKLEIKTLGLRDRIKGTSV